jgi:hypothetical protein
LGKNRRFQGVRNARRSDVALNYSDVEGQLAERERFRVRPPRKLISGNSFEDALRGLRFLIKLHQDGIDHSGTGLAWTGLRSHFCFEHDFSCLEIDGGITRRYKRPNKFKGQGQNEFRGRELSANSATKTTGHHKRCVLGHASTGRWGYF